MAKKSKRNIKALLAKRAELQALSDRPSLSIPGAPKVARSLAELPASPVSTEPMLTAHHAGREIWRTLLATAIIAVILVAVVISDRQRPYLQHWGDKLYKTLQLG